MKKVWIPLIAIILIASTTQAMTCSKPVLKEIEPFALYSITCTIPHEQAVALNTSPQEIVPAVPGAMLLPRFFAISKVEGAIFTTTGVTRVGVDWFGGEAEIPISAMMFSSPSHYMFGNVEAANMVIYNSNAGFAPYAFAAGYTVEGAALRLSSHGANLGGGFGPLTIKLQWQVIPMDFSIPVTDYDE